jgi:hypothetical protein
LWANKNIKKEQDSIMVYKRKKEEDAQGVIAKLPIGKAKNHHKWRGVTRWRFDGRLMTGPDFYKFCITFSLINGVNFTSFVFTWLVSRLSIRRSIFTD